MYGLNFRIFGRKQEFVNVSVCINTRFQLQLVNNEVYTCFFSFIYLEGNTSCFCVRWPVNIHVAAISVNLSVCFFSRVFVAWETRLSIFLRQLNVYKV